jgi:hypothetical protein
VAASRDLKLHVTDQILSNNNNNNNNNNSSQSSKSPHHFFSKLLAAVQTQNSPSPFAVMSLALGRVEEGAGPRLNAR